MIRCCRPAVVVIISDIIFTNVFAVCRRRNSDNQILSGRGKKRKAPEAVTLQGVMAEIIACAFHLSGQPGM